MGKLWWNQLFFWAQTSETNYSESNQSSQVKGITLDKNAFTIDTSHNFGGRQATCISDQLAVNSGVSTTPSDSVIH